MKTLFRRLVLPVMLAALLAVPSTAADDVSDKDDWVPWVEFDKKPQSNPKSPAPGELVVTGKYRLAPGRKLLSIEVLQQLADNPSANFRSHRAVVDEKTMTWMVKAKDVEPGTFWFHVSIQTIDENGQKFSWDSLDKRRHSIPAKK